jgi:hypothetical protein
MTDGLVAALARAQSKFPPIVKSHTNPAFKGSQYADVADVLAAVRPVLAAEGIVVTQVTFVDSETGAVNLITKLMHEDDEQISSVFPLHVSGLTDQQVGSKLTYNRRYQLCAILGVHPVGDDDDGNLAATAPVAPAKTTTVRAPDDWETRPLATMTFAELRDVAYRVGLTFSGGSKAELIRQLDPLMQARTGAEPFDLVGAEPIPAKPDEHAAPFTPTTFDEDLRAKNPSARQSIRNSMREPE